MTNTDPATLNVTGTGNDLRVNDAGLMCGGVTTANATASMIGRC